MTTILKKADTSAADVRASAHPMLERIESMAHRVEYRRMVDYEDREAIFHLRRNAYSRHKGDSDAWGAAELDDPHEPNSVTIGLFIDKRLVGSFKVIVVTNEFPDCQSRNFFKDEVDALLASGKMLIDPVRFVADTRATTEFPELPFLLIRIPIMACQYFDADACLSLIKKEHAPFYKRVFRSKIVGGPKWYPPLEIDALLMCGGVDVVRQDVLQRFPCWRASVLEMRQMFGPLSEWPAVMARMDNAA